jgi:hypothetical protein
MAVPDSGTQSGGKPFEIYDPDTRYVFVPDSELVKEISDAPDTVLSLHAASKQVWSTTRRTEPRLTSI